MLERVANAILEVVNYLPAQFVTQDSPNFTLVRAMFGLIFIVLIVFLISSAKPVCTAIAHYLTRTRK
jgi:hypothetical protein